MTADERFLTDMQTLFALFAVFAFGIRMAWRFGEAMERVPGPIAEDVFRLEQETA